MQQLIQEVKQTLGKGDSEQMGELSDYYYENEIEDNTYNFGYNNEQIQEVIKTLTELNAKAKNSVIASGTDVTDLLINGHFDGTGGWVATLNDFSLDSGKNILERCFTWSSATKTDR